MYKFLRNLILISLGKLFWLFVFLTPRGPNFFSAVWNCVFLSDFYSFQLNREPWPIRLIWNWGENPLFRGILKKKIGFFLGNYFVINGGPFNPKKIFHSLDFFTGSFYRRESQPPKTPITLGARKTPLVLIYFRKKTFQLPKNKTKFFLFFTGTFVWAIREFRIFLVRGFLYLCRGFIRQFFKQTGVFRGVLAGP